MKFRKKPIVVEATQWFKNGDHPNDEIWRPYEDTGITPETPREGLVVRFFRSPFVDGQDKCKDCSQIMHNHGWIDARDNGHKVCPGDWVITGTKGEYYPCKPDIFKETYEPYDNDEGLFCIQCHADGKRSYLEPIALRKFRCSNCGATGYDPRDFPIFRNMDIPL